jgi:hypothetical protein
MAEHDDRRGVTLLTWAGVAIAGIALLHLGVIVAGAPAYRYFGAGETLAQLAEGGSLAPTGLTLLIALLFGTFAAYALSGAGRLRGLPLLHTGLIGISSVFLFRGIAAIPEAAALIFNPEALPLRHFVFSLVSFVVGACCALGTRAAWRRLSPVRGAG